MLHCISDRLLYSKSRRLFIWTMVYIVQSQLGYILLYTPCIQSILWLTTYQINVQLWDIEVSWLQSVLARWMVFLYQTFVKCQLMRFLHPIVFIWSAQEETEHLQDQASSWVISWDLSNISLMVWTIFLVWSEHYFSCNLENIWTIFLLWSEQYFYMNSIYLFSRTYNFFCALQGFNMVWH